MISVIVCSVDEALYQAFAVNIAKTIGVEFEIIRIDNSNNAVGICAAYNKGIEDASYPILCFVHEDVIMQTGNWGRKLVEIFQGDPAVGLLGVAGTMYKSFAPWGWGLVPEARVVNIIQQHKYDNRPGFHDYNNPRNENLSEVACIDGVFMCTKKYVADEIKFDAKTLLGFHGYDIDFSLSIGKKYKVAVTFDILLTHLSEGKNDNAWIEATLKLHNKWKNELPVATDPGYKGDYSVHETRAVTEFLYLMVERNCTTWQMLGMLNYNNRNKLMDKKVLLNLKIRILKDWLKARYEGIRVLS